MMLYCIVVVGGGVGGLELVIVLGNKVGRKWLVEVILVDVSMIYLWKFKLYEVVVGVFNVDLDELNYVVYVKCYYFCFIMGCMLGLDWDNKELVLVLYYSNGEEVLLEWRLFYDILVIFIGSNINDFGI